MQTKLFIGGRWRDGADGAVIEVTDQMGRCVRIEAPARRIISLVPSQSELLFDLGLGPEVVGVTRFCTAPAAAVANVPRIGGTKRFLFERIDALAPDLILGNKEENYPEGIERLAKRYPVWMSDVYDLDDALEMITAIGVLVDRQARATALADEIRQAFTAIKPGVQRRTAYFIWRKPWMVAGSGTFIDHIMARLGLQNVFADLPRYPQVSDEALRAAGPELALLSSEPFPFDDRHVREVRALLPGADVRLVDATYFSWYGSRLRQAPKYLAEFAA